MNTPAFSVCVYCGSRNGIQPEYADVARQVGTWIGQHNGQLVYGGGNNGLMGLVAQATADAGGRVVGIIPKALQTKENTRTACTELYVVNTMHERKHMMAERADVFLPCLVASAPLKNFLRCGLGASWATTTNPLAYSTHKAITTVYCNLRKTACNKAF